jgi:four helix bundle protein
MGNYIELGDLEVYKLARKLSSIAWSIYDQLSWQDKKTMGDQFISSVDSVGANIAEAYGRFHYLDRIKFCYYSRGSYIECSSHWLSLLTERKKITLDQSNEFLSIGKDFFLKLNNYINSLYNSKDNKESKS